METLVINIEKDRLQQIKDFLTTMNVQFVNPITHSKTKNYNPEFVAEIMESRQQLKEGKLTRIKTSDLWK